MKQTHARRALRLVRRPLLWLLALAGCFGLVQLGLAVVEALPRIIERLK